MFFPQAGREKEREREKLAFTHTHTHTHTKRDDCVSFGIIRSDFRLNGFKLLDVLRPQVRNNTVQATAQPKRKKRKNK